MLKKLLGVWSKLRHMSMLKVLYFQFYNNRYVMLYLSLLAIFMFYTSVFVFQFRWQISPISKYAKGWLLSLCLQLNLFQYMQNTAVHIWKENLYPLKTLYTLKDYRFKKVSCETYKWTVHFHGEGYALLRVKYLVWLYRHVMYEIYILVCSY